MVGLLSVIGVIALFFRGFYYQTESDTVFPVYMFGIYNGGTNAIPDTFGCFSLISHVFNHLYLAGAGSDIYDWFQLLAVLICVAYWSYQVLGRVFFSSGARWLSAPLAVAIMDPLLPLEFSKTAMMLSITGFHVTLVGRAWNHFLIGGMLVALGFLVRAEPATIMLVMLFLVALTQLGHSFHRRWVLSIALSATVILSLSIAVTNAGRKPADVRYKEIRPYEYVLVDFRKDLDEAGISDRDKVKLKAAQSFFFADTDELNVAFFEQVGVRPMDKSPMPLFREFIEFDWFVDGWSRFLHSAGALKFHFLALLLLPALLWNRHPRLAVFIVLIIALILTMSLFLKTEHHFITAIITVAVIIVCCQYLVETSTEKERTTGWGAGLLTVLALLMMSEKLSIVARSKEKNDYFQGVAADLDALRPESLVLNVSFWDRYRYRLFAPIKPVGHRLVTVCDGGIIHLNDSYQQMLIQRTGKRAFSKQFEELIGAGDRIFVSSDQRMNLITEYFNVVHGCEVSYMEMPGLEGDAHFSDEERIRLFKVSLEGEE